MAVFKGREVEIMGKVGGTDTGPLYTIQHKQGNREDVRLDELELTEAEVKEMEKNATWHLGSAKVIKDKDLQDLRDKQDKQKIEEQQKKNPQQGLVEVDKIMVDSEEVKTGKKVK